MLLRRPGRGILIMASVVILFGLGLLMEGMLFKPQRGDLLTTVIYCGGFVGNGCVGQTCSPWTSVLVGTGRSSIGHTGLPLTRSKT